jgi:phosphoenolpyruvate---glycerone phosphotransferase subunit DhaL
MRPAPLASGREIWPTAAMGEFTSRHLVDLFRLISLRLSEARSELGALDGAIGDADHGNAMADGFAAVVRATSAEDTRAPSEIMAIAGRSFLSAVGATTGPLYASAMQAAAQKLHGKTSVSAADVAGLVPSFAEGIAQRGKARQGDKTMMDAWAPAARAVTEGAKAGLPALEQLHRAAAAAREGRDDTRAMIAAMGRAARLGARSLGHVDPGAASASIIIATLQEWLRLQLFLESGECHG